MNRGALIRLALFALAAAPASAQNSLEIISLRYRTAEQVMPALRPLLEPGATLSGQSGQLFVRASAANLAELRRALEAIDRPLRRLLIAVRFEQATDIASRDIRAGGRIGSGGASVRIQASDARSRGEERVDQRVSAMEGSRAMIYTGESRPVRQRQFIQTPAGVVSQEVTVVQDLATGFEVIARVSASTVTVEIAQQRATVANAQRAQTAASGRLGEWFELGSVAMSGTTRRVWVRVDEVP